jgi:hypothetical protein
MRCLIIGLAVIGALAFAQDKRTFTGKITDSMCATADHSQMKMGSDDAECTNACVNVHGAAYVLYDGKKAYILSDQKTPEKFAGKAVTVIGTLDARTATIQVESIVANGAVAPAVLNGAVAPTRNGALRPDRGGRP